MCFDGHVLFSTSFFLINIVFSNVDLLSTIMYIVVFVDFNKSYFQKIKIKLYLFGTTQMEICVVLWQCM